MNFSILNITYAVGRLSRYIHSPNHDHREALMRLMRYLRGTTNYDIEYSGIVIVLEGYNETNYISNSYETKSTSR
uniref:Retrovirus-related Pol polyprotein from transposon TNT 1-94 n=1 Tax=Cajanus cajan TaxID=3821 RepID=A0A151T9P9_CAJCA|nr:hypothetical protein KK1_018345 [Cajanus cajan]